MEPLANSRMVSVVVVSILASISVPVVVGMRAEVEIEAEASEGSHRISPYRERHRAECTSQFPFWRHLPSLNEKRTSVLREREGPFSTLTSLPAYPTTRWPPTSCDPMTELTEFWCHVEGKHSPFTISIALNRRIDHLRTETFNKLSDSIERCGVMGLTLTKVCYMMISM